MRDVSGRPRTRVLLDLIKRRELIFFLRISLGALFLFASLDKIQNPHQFSITVRAYQIIPVELSGLFALLVSWSEAVAGSLLILGLLTRKAASAVFILLVLFIAAITTTLIRGLIIDCGCFKAGGNSHIIDVGLLVRDVFLLLAALLVIQFDRGFLGLSSIIQKRKEMGSG